MNLSRSLTALLISYLVVFVFYIDARISLCLCIFLIFTMLLLARHSLPLLMLQFISLNTLIYTVSFRSLPQYVTFLTSDLFRACLYFAIFTITSSLLLAGNELVTTKPSLFEHARRTPSTLLPFVLYVLAFIFLLSQGRTYSYSVVDTYEKIPMTSLYDYSYVVLANALVLSRSIERRFSTNLLLAFPFIFLELYSGRRVGLLGICLLLLFTHSITRINSRSWLTMGYFSYLPVIAPLFFVLKLVGSIRVIYEAGQYGVSPSSILDLVLPRTSTTTELQSLFTTAHYYAIDSVRDGFFSLLDPLRQFLSSFAGAATFDMVEIVDSRFFTLGGLLPVSSFSSIPVILAPIFILLSLVFLGFFFSLIRLCSVDPLTIAAVTIVVLPRFLLYNFSLLPRFLLMCIPLALISNLTTAGKKSPSNA